MVIKNLRLSNKVVISFLSQMPQAVLLLICWKLSAAFVKTHVNNILFYWLLRAWESEIDLLQFFPSSRLHALLLSHVWLFPPAEYQSLVLEDSLEEGMAANSSILAWRISIGKGAWWATVHRVARVGPDWVTYHTHMDCSLPVSSVHGTFQARVLEWVACPSPGNLPSPGIEP